MRWLIVALLLVGFLPSPVTAAPVTQTVTLSLAEAADDVVETNDSSVALTEGRLFVGRSGSGSVKDIGLRFVDCPVPPGATIQEARLVVTSFTYDLSDSVATVFRGLETLNVTAFSSTNRPSQIAKTSAAVSWSPGSWSSNRAYRSPNLRALVQEIVGQPGWRQGNAIGVVWEDNGSRSFRTRTIYSRDYYQTSSRGAKLSITYTYDPDVGAPDTTPPTVGITAPAEGASVSGAVAFTADATDDRGVEGVGFYADGALITTDAAAPYACAWDTASFSNGQHTLTARAVDTSGNVSSASRTCTVTNDVTPPVISDLRIVAVGTSAVTVAWTTGEAATSRLEYGTTASYGSSTPTDAALATAHQVTISGLTPSTTYHVGAVSQDAAGNEAVSSDVAVTTAAQPVAQSFTVDLLGPNDDVVEVDDVSLLALDGSLEVGRGNGTNVTDVGLRFPSVPLPKGAVVEDAHLVLTSFSYGVSGGLDSVFRGLKSSAVPAFSAASRPSQIAKTSASVPWVPAAWTPNTVYPSPDLKDVVQEIVDQPGWQEGGPVALVWEDAATPAWQARLVYSRDFWEGTTRGPRLSITYSYDPGPDVTPPVVQITSPAPGATVSGVVPFTAAVTDDRAVGAVAFYAGDAVIATDTTPPYACDWDTSAYASGTHTLQVRAVDSAGNTASASTTCDVYRDTTPPVISNVAVSPGTRSATITWTTNEPASSVVAYGKTSMLGSITVDPAPATAHSVIVTGLDPSSIYHFSVRSADGSGNSASSMILTFSTSDAPSVPGPPVASFSFDDTFANAGTVAFPVLRAHGFRATEFVCTDLVGADGKLTLAQLREMRDAGWEIGSHTADHNVGMGTPMATYEASVKKASDWLGANGFDGGGFASPGGAWSHDIVEIVREYHPYLRVADNSLTGHPYDPYKVSTYFLNSATTIAEVRGWLDAAQRDQSWIVFSMHGVSDAGFDTRPALLEDICRELETRHIQVFPMNEIISADRPPATTIDCWVDSTQQPVMPTVEAPSGSLDPSRWNEYWEQYFGYPVVEAMTGVVLPTMRFSRSVPNGTYDVYATLYSSDALQYRYYYSFDNPANPQERHVDSRLVEGDIQYSLGTVTVTNGTFSLYTNRIDALSGPDWYGAWGWIKLVP